MLLIGTLFFSGQALAYSVSVGTPTTDGTSWSVPVIATGETRALYGYNFDLYYNSPFIFIDTDFGIFANYLLKASFDLIDSNNLPYVAVTVFDDGSNPLNPLMGGDPITLAILKFSGNGDPAGFAVQNATLAPVPEPGSFILLGLGLAGLVGYRRKCRKA